MGNKRKSRKTDHINHSLLLEKNLKRDAFKDIKILHNCLSDVDIDDIDISTSLAGITLKNPIIINAITGGMPEGERINRELAKIAKKHKLAMAVGSQRIAFKDPESEASFKIVRETNPDGVIFANLGADVTVDEAQRAIDMIGANALQIHLNAPQEIIMLEGRKNFKGTLENISNIIKYVNVPVIVKEVGFGIAAEEAGILAESGVEIIDVGGAGGTNFLSIENKRIKDMPFQNFENWGIPTPISLVEVVETVKDKIAVIASGGLANGLDATKSLALGAKATAFAGIFLKVLLNEGSSALSEHIIQIEKEIIYTMAMAGVHNIMELQKRPVIILGKTREWLKNRGFIR